MSKAASSLTTGFLLNSMANRDANSELSTGVERDECVLFTSERWDRSTYCDRKKTGLPCLPEPSFFGVALCENSQWGIP